MLALGAGSSRVGVIAYTFSVFVLASIVLEFARGTSARSDARRHATSGPIPINRSSGSPKLCRKKL